MRRNLAWRPLALLTLVLLPATAGAQEIKAGASAPEIELPLLAGGKVKLSSLRGHPVVVTFWGTWCPPCQAEFPELVAAHHRYRESGLEVLAVNQRDQELSTREVQSFVTQHAAEFLVVLDARGKARRSFRLIALPTTVFIDAAGMIQHVHSGAITPKQLAAGLATILPPKQEEL